MGRFRQWRKTGAALGLFALVLQLWLSFGHVHADAGAPARAEAAALSAPAEHDDDTAAHRELCAICVTVQLLASSLVPPTPALTLPTFVARADHALAVDQNTRVAAPRRFHARAPPLA